MDFIPIKLSSASIFRIKTEVNSIEVLNIKSISCTCNSQHKITTDKSSKVVKSQKPHLKKEIF